MNRAQFHPSSVLLALALSSGASLAAEPPKSDTPADYAYALPLQVSGKQGVVGFRLPLAVYQHALSASLNDLRVFDAKGVLQPYALYRPTVETAAKRANLPATIFPIRSTANTAGAPNIALDIRTRPDGSVLSVQANTSKTASNAALSGLILDFGPGAKATDTNATRIDALRFSAPKDKPNYTAQVWLETSNDLKQWETVGAAELSWLTSDNAQILANDRLEFSPQAFRYARLTWRSGEAVPFPSIQAETLTRQNSEPPRETLWLKPVAGKKAGDLVYAAGVAMPVEQVSLKLSEPNIVYPMALGQYVERPSRHTGKPTEWVFQPLTHATFYQITQNGQTRRSGPLNIGLSHQQEWVIRPQNAAATTQPELGLAWQPATLVFLAGGTPPYTLSFSRSDTTPASQMLEQVAPGFSLKEINQLEQAQTGSLQASKAGPAGDSAATLAGLSAQNRTFMLWGVLLLGVLVLGGMAWKLVKQINTEKG